MQFPLKKKGTWQNKSFIQCECEPCLTFLVSNAGPQATVIMSAASKDISGLINQQHINISLINRSIKVKTTVKLQYSTFMNKASFAHRCTKTLRCDNKQSDSFFFYLISSKPAGRKQLCAPLKVTETLKMKVINNDPFLFLLLMFLSGKY